MVFNVTGTLFESNGTTVIPNTTVIITNVETNENLSVVANGSGVYTGDVETLTSGIRNGDLFNVYSARGTDYGEAIFNIVLPGSSKTQDILLEQSVTISPLYASVADVRRFNGIDTAEYDDAAILSLIRKATDVIKEETGRSWDGIKTITDELHDGDGTNQLWIGQQGFGVFDITEITKVEVDESGSGTYTLVTSTHPSAVAGVFFYKDEGRIQMTQESNVSTFTNGLKTIRLTYKAGNLGPEQKIKALVGMIIDNWLNFMPEKQMEIDSQMNTLKAGGPDGPI